MPRPTLVGTRKLPPPKVGRGTGSPGGWIGSQGMGPPQEDRVLRLVFSSSLHPSYGPDFCVRPCEPRARASGRLPCRKRYATVRVAACKSVTIATAGCSRGSRWDPVQYNPSYNYHAYNDILVIAIFFPAPIHFSYNERYYDISLSLP